MTKFSDLNEDGVAVLTAGDNVMIVGTAWYVDSTHASKSDASGYGTSPDTPFATLDYAIGAAAANNGDVIYLAPGHAETKAAAGSLWAADKAGQRIIGLGNGADRPTFTFSDTAAVCTISAASVYIENILLVAGVDSVVAPLTISAADVTLKNVEFRDTTDVEFVAGVITTAAADRLTIDGLYYNGYTGGNACTIGVKLVGTNGAVIRNSRFHGLFSTGCIQMVTTVCTDIVIENCYFLNTGTAVTKDVVMGVAACTYQVKDCFDGVAGYCISGSNVVDPQYFGPPITTLKACSSLPNNAATALMNYIGAIKIIDLFGVVTTIIQAQATTVKWQLAPSTQAAATDLTAGLDVNAFDPGSVVRTTLDISDAALGSDDVAQQEGEAYAAQPLIAYGDAITSAVNIHSSTNSTGAITTYLTWLPISPGAYVKAA